MSPGPRLLWLLLLLAMIALLGVLVPATQALLVIAAVAIAIVTLMDLFLLRSQRRPQVARTVDANLPHNSSVAVKISIDNVGQQHLQMAVSDDYPSAFDCNDMPIQLNLEGGGRGMVTYHVTPLSRGSHRFGAIDLLLQSPFHLWRRRVSYPADEVVHVFPNFAEVAHFALLARRNRLGDAGVRRRQRRGQGSDFHQLRDYHAGDALRQIDWKATARFRRLIAREYQDEQNQNLFFLIDCGRRMRHTSDGRAHLDQALNAVLLAAYIAVNQGDAVGYMTFAGTDRYFAPRKGSGTVPALLRSSYDLQSSAHAADYVTMAERFLARGVRRTLLVLVTNTRDGDYRELLLAVRMLQTRHLVVVADMRESVVDEVFDHPVTQLDDALRLHSAVELVRARRDAHEQMRHQGAIVIDILPQQLPLALVNEYYDIKRSGRL